MGANPIVVGVDGSVTSEHAAKVALELAAALGASLHIVSVYSESYTEAVRYGPSKVLVSVEDKSRDAATQAAETFQDSSVDIHAVSLVGKPSSALIRYAESVDAGIIVVGNRGMRGVSRFLGSVSNDISHRASMNVFIVNTEHKAIQ